MAGAHATHGTDDHDGRLVKGEVSPGNVALNAVLRRSAA